MNNGTMVPSSSTFLKPTKDLDNAKQFCDDPRKNNLSFKIYIDFIVISVSSDHTHNRIQNGNGHQLSLFGFRVKEVLSLSIITNYCLTSHFCIFQNFKANEGIKKKKSTE